MLLGGSAAAQVPQRGGDVEAPGRGYSGYVAPPGRPGASGAVSRAIRRKDDGSAGENFPRGAHDKPEEILPFVLQKQPPGRLDQLL